MSRFSFGALPVLALLAVVGLRLSGAESEGKILRPADHSSFARGAVDVVATAPSGKLTLDGLPVEASQPYPDVFHTMVEPSEGPHRLVLEWADGKREVEFFVGANAPAGYAPFHQHPPAADVECGQCHGLSRQGQFIFKGGCFDCHQQGEFAKAHIHPPEILSQCGMCHNPHGSTVKAHLILSKEAACKQCHD